MLPEKYAKRFELYKHVSTFSEEINKRLIVAEINTENISVARTYEEQKGILHDIIFRLDTFIRYPMVKMLARTI